MKRYDCMTLLAKRLKDELVILSLGASVDEWYNAAPHMRAASLFQQQLGCVTPQAFGLAAGLPHRRRRSYWPRQSRKPPRAKCPQAS